MDNFNMYYNLRGLEYFKDKELIADVTSMMHEGFPILMERIDKFNRDNGEALAVEIPVCNFMGITRLMYHDKPETSMVARERMRQIYEYLKTGTCRLLGGYSSGFFANNDMQRVIIERRINNQIAVLTQDVSLCKDMAALSCENSYSVLGQKVEVCKLTRAGEISDFIIIENKTENCDRSSGQEDGDIRPGTVADIAKTTAAEQSLSREFILERAKGLASEMMTCEDDRLKDYAFKASTITRRRFKPDDVVMLRFLDEEEEGDAGLAFTTAGIYCWEEDDRYSFGVRYEDILSVDYDEDGVILHVNENDRDGSNVFGMILNGDRDSIVIPCETEDDDEKISEIRRMYNLLADLVEKAGGEQ